MECIGPAPPKATREKSRGSIPLEIVKVRIASAILELAISQIPSAVSITLKPSWCASFSIALYAACQSSFIFPPKKPSASIRPKIKLASVTVASVPPFP